MIFKKHLSFYNIFLFNFIKEQWNIRRKKIIYLREEIKKYAYFLLMMKFIHILILNLKFYFIFYISQNTVPICIPFDDNKI